MNPKSALTSLYIFGMENFLETRSKATNPENLLTQDSSNKEKQRNCPTNSRFSRYRKLVTKILIPSFILWNGFFLITVVLEQDWLTGYIYLNQTDVLQVYANPQHKYQNHTDTNCLDKGLYNYELYSQDPQAWHYAYENMSITYQILASVSAMFEWIWFFSSIFYLFALSEFLVEL